MRLKVRNLEIGQGPLVAHYTLGEVIDGRARLAKTGRRREYAARTIWRVIF